MRCGPYDVDWRDGSGDALIIAFSSIGHDPSRSPSPEFVATTRGLGRTIFIRDHSRSWTTNPSFGPMLQHAVSTLSVPPPRRIMTIGLSMGAFSALMATQFIAVDTVLAFGPQSSLTDEARWREWTDRLSHHPTVPTIPARTWACVFHGLRDDRHQATGYAQQTGIDHILFPDLGHSDLMAHLRSRGGLTGIAQAALDGDRRRLLRIASSGGGKLRQKLSSLHR